MKHLLLLSFFMTFYSCSGPGNSSAPDRTATLRPEQVEQNFPSEFNKKYIAEVRTSIEAKENELTFLDAAYDSDQDVDYNCEIDLGANRQFKYFIERDHLTLFDDSVMLKFSRVDGFSSEELIGSWEMIESSEKIQIVTELIINDLEELKLRKTCNLK
jgi:hypothetical protein